MSVTIDQLNFTIVVSTVYEIKTDAMDTHLIGILIASALLCNSSFIKRTLTFHKMSGTVSEGVAHSHIQLAPSYVQTEWIVDAIVRS